MRTAPLTAAALCGLCAAQLAAQVPLSNYANGVWFPLAGGQPMPDNLFDTSNPNAFSTMTVGGQDTLTATWIQTVTINRFNPMPIGPFQAPQIIQVTESASQAAFYEAGEQTFVTDALMDPILNTALVLGPTLPGTMQLQLVDANPGQPGFQHFVNDMFPLVPVPNGTPIAIWTGPSEIIRIVSPMGNTVATNVMRPFQIASLPIGTPLDNAFGIFEGGWSVIDLDIDGVPSPYLDVWEDIPQIRWKPHPGGWAAVVIGAPLPGPAGVLHFPPAAPRACCLPDGSCEMMVSAFCLSLGGTPLAAGAGCEGDNNKNGIDDACELSIIGDLNCDGFVTVTDIGPFVLAITDTAGYVIMFPECNKLNADINGDGAVTVGDIGPFVQLLAGG